MDNEYTTHELADMHFTYGRANGNSYEARRLYREMYQNRRIPSAKIFQRIHQRLRETGSCKARKNDCGRHRSVRTVVDVEQRILRRVENDHSISVRRISALEGINRHTVWLTLREQLLFPYHLQRVQALNAADYPLRLNFCRWFLRKVAVIPDFLSQILATDEAGFNRDGITNYHNTHCWADENPHAILEDRHQVRFSVNVWIGILGDRILGPVFLPNR